MEWTDEQMAFLLVEELGDALIEQMKDAFFILSFLDGRLDPRKVDPLLSLQIGAALLLEKPLILISVNGAPVAARLRLIADAVIVDDGLDVSEMRERLWAAVEKVTAKRPIV